MTETKQNEIMYAALREIVSIANSGFSWVEEVNGMENAARKAIDAVESDPAPKTLAELREISHAADRVANAFGDAIDLCTSEELREVERQYNVAREASHLAFRAMVDHPDYKGENTKC